MPRDDHPTYRLERQKKLIEHLASPRNYVSDKYFMETLHTAEEEMGPDLTNRAVGKRLIRRWRMTTNHSRIDERVYALEALAKVTSEYLGKTVPFSDLRQILARAVKEADYV